MLQRSIFSYYFGLFPERFLLACMLLAVTLKGRGNISLASISMLISLFVLPLIICSQKSEGGYIPDSPNSSLKDCPLSSKRWISIPPLAYTKNDSNNKRMALCLLCYKNIKFAKLTCLGLLIICKVLKEKFQMNETYLF